MFINLFVNECFIKEEQASLFQNKIKAITEKLDISEQKLIEFATMPDIEVDIYIYIYLSIFYIFI